MPNKLPPTPNLADLVFSLDEFTEDDLLTKFGYKYGGYEFERDIVSEYLEELTQLGYLRNDYGTYSVIQ